MSKYVSYFDCDGCKKLANAGHANVLKNIAEDDEAYVTESMKVEFFEYIKKHDGISDIVEYCDNFFEEPKGSDLVDKKYILKGITVSGRIYKVELGRVASKNGFRWGLNSSILKLKLTDPSGISPISDDGDEALIESLLIDCADFHSTSTSLFSDFVDEIGLSNQKIQERPMWTFENGYYEEVYRGYEIKDLPCILGLPGPERTEKEYDKIDRITFSIKIPNTIEIKKPTSFDAGVMSVWRIGGKTKTHSKCEKKYGEFGFEEYVHAPIDFKNITSELYKL
jgi:hypothetical protein